MLPIQKMHKAAVRRRASALLAAVALLVLILALAVQPVQALTYYFAVPKMTVDVTVNADGTVSLDYDYQFQNQSSGEPIQYVDIGMPTNNYELNSASGLYNGQMVNVEKSTEVKGIALNLGSRAIPSGQSGEVFAHIGVVRGMLFKANTKESEPYASFQFEPNFFGSQYVTGSTDTTVTLHLPPGLKPEEPRYFTPKNWPGQAKPDETGLDKNGNVYYTWHSASASSSANYTFGASFPSRLVPASALLTEVPFTIDTGNLCPWAICLGVFGLIAASTWGSIAGNRKRRLQYLPPTVSVEGNGIKRGLTAVEAAILMEQPMDKILTMILFSVVKKNAAAVTSREPMKIQVTTPAPEGLLTYETDFLTAMAKTAVREQRLGLQDMMTALVKSVSEKMRGFSRKDTVAYYKDIMTKAWAQVEAAQTPEMKMQAFDDAMDWTMLDRNFNDRTRQTFPGPVIVPMWWGRFDPTIGSHPAASAPSFSTPSMPSGPGNQAPQGISLPSLPGGNFASSMAVGMQSFANSVVGNITAFTGTITNKTNPVPVTPPSSSSSGGGWKGGGSSGGGGHCACACACACAGCACACAGGGR